MILLYLLSFFLLLLMILNHNLSLISPTVFFVVVNTMAMCGGYYLYGLETEGASVVLYDQNTSFYDVALKSSILVFCFSFASFLACIFYRPKILSRLVYRDVIVLVERVPNYIVCVIVFFAIFSFVLGNGVEGFWLRSEYMIESFQGLKIFGGLVLIVAPLLIGAKEKSIGFLVSILLVFVICMIQLAYSSRMSALTPLSYVAGCLLVGSRDAIKLKLTTATALSLLLTGAALELRGMRQQGLAIVFDYLFSIRFFENFNVMIVLNNLLFSSFAITSLTAVTAAINDSYMMTSYNPLPGFMTNWYSLDRGINESTPFSMMGEHISYSLFFGAFIYSFLGVIYTVVAVKARDGDVVHSLLGFAMLNIATLTMLQYTTRTSIRIVLYYFAILFILWIFRKFGGKNFGANLS